MHGVKDIQYCTLYREGCSYRVQRTIPGKGNHIFTFLVFNFFAGSRQLVVMNRDRIFKLLKGQCQEIFCFWFFHESVSPQLLTT
jgi:hypothetical protein